MNKEFQPGEKLIVILRTHRNRTKKGIATEIPAHEIEGTFVEYRNEKKFVLVEVRTKAEGKIILSYPLSRLRKKHE